MAAISSSSSVEEQVFINYYCGDQEIRNGFVSHLVKALQSNNINVFITKLEDRGEPIETLMERIEKSRIAVVIFSERYTESIWCLREVAKIKDCMDEGTLGVIPIFYKVAPSTVKYLKGDFGDEFRNMAKYDERKEKWEEALKAIADLMGTIVDEKSDNSDIIEKTVEDVKKALKRISSEGSQIASVDLSPNSDIIEGPPQHQVFINCYCGDQEIRNGFVSHLVKALQSNGINVFIDNHEDRGEAIEILMDRIEESRIAVVIFSGRYTESIWCLRDAAKIKDCMDKGTLKVIPIFYKVKPSTVRYLQGDFGDEFRNRASGDERKKEWKEALKAIANIMGTMVDEKSDESIIIEKFVEEVKSELNRIPLMEESQKAYVDSSENSYTQTSSGGVKDKVFGIKQSLINGFKENVNRNKIRSNLGMIIGCLLLLFFIPLQIAYMSTRLIGEGGAINRIVDNVPKLPEYIPAEGTEDPRDTYTERHWRT